MDVRRRAFFRESMLEFEIFDIHDILKFDIVIIIIAILS